jgi:hypothetical protein
MLHHLFQRVGFIWGLRIDAFVSGAGCVVATILTTNIPQPRKAGSRSIQKALLDVRFVLLTLGGCLVVLGRKVSSAVHQILIIFIFRNLHTLFLYRGIFPEYVHHGRFIFRPPCFHERRWCGRPNLTCNRVRPNRQIQLVGPISASFGDIMRHIVVRRSLHRSGHHVLHLVRVLVRVLHLAHYALYCSNFRIGRDWDEDGVAV